MLRITLLSGEEVASLPLTELSDVKALKQRLHQQHGMPPRFRQRLLHDGSTLGDDVKLETAMDLQILIVDFDKAAEVLRLDLYDAAGLGNLTQVERMLQLPMDPDICDHELDQRYITLLIHASENGQADVVQLLLEAGADKNLCDIDGCSPLLTAAKGGHAPVLRLLLEAGAQVDLPSSGGRTALMCAASEGHQAVLQLLLEAGAQKDARDNRGNTALIYSAMTGHARVAELLLEAGADKDVRDINGNTALMMATTPEIRRLLEVSHTT
ncbi:Ankyrin repeat domain-containing protein 50 [Symbiodinium microadriaticum]|uniref:Ankyrin repeat domain-containing protein 50 n=1 Tax=Symbiodinium microadriaticum TaxID=2951 RepID=A0A1Q9EUL2_SYMMI|nr:Ankyrin repeat domain-containing protein 50 [Symbiodinium microadriaticum]